MSADSSALKGQLVTANNADLWILVVGRRVGVAGKVFDIDVEGFQCLRQRLAVAVGLEHNGGVFRNGPGGVVGTAVEIERPYLCLGRSINLAPSSNYQWWLLVSAVLAVFGAACLGIRAWGVSSRAAPLGWSP